MKTRFNVLFVTASLISCVAHADNCGPSRIEPDTFISILIQEEVRY